MANRFFRLGFLAVPAASLAFGIIAACSSDDPADPPITQQPDATFTDAPQQGDTSQPQNDGSTTTDSGDGGTITDAQVEAEASLPALCVKYPDNPADASAAEGPRKLYELIAVRAILEAADSCEIGSHFVDPEDPPPSQFTCLGRQLASVAGCLSGGAPIDYNAATDENFEKCVPGVGMAGDTVQIGLRNPATSGYTSADVDHMITLIRKAALSTGMATADADRLKTLLTALKAKAAPDGGDAGLSMSVCP